MQVLECLIDIFSVKWSKETSFIIPGSKARTRPKFQIMYGLPHHPLKKKEGHISFILPYRIGMCTILLILLIDFLEHSG